MAEKRRYEGRVLLERYRLESLLGEGGMGTIWRAEHLVLKAPVAVKMVDRDLVVDDDTKSRFMREAQSAAALRSPHVVQIFDYGVDDHIPFIVMELLEGENLSQRIKGAGRLSPAETGRIVSHIGRAVGRAHEAGIVHRDLKPENVFLVKNDDEEVAKVLDFGVAKVPVASLGPEGARTRTGSLLGTPYYMSPEQAQGNKTVDHRSDLWSLAIIAFECLTGQRPFSSDGLGDLVLQICVRDIPVPSEVAPVPLGFDAWFACATQRDPERRFQSARELSDSLRDALGIEIREQESTEPDVLVQRGARAAPNSAAARSSFAGTAARPTQPGPPSSRQESASPDETAPESERDEAAAEADENESEDAPLAPSRKQFLVVEPTLTLSQFGTAQQSSSRARGTTAILGVAATALGAGLVLGFVMLRPKGEPELPTVPRRAVGAETAPAAPNALPEAGALSEFDEDAGDLEAEQAQDASAELDASADEVGSAALAPGREDKRDAAAADAGPNGAWVKPAWAIPDDEPVESKPPVPASTPENPY